MSKQYENIQKLLALPYVESAEYNVGCYSTESGNGYEVVLKDGYIWEGSHVIIEQTYAQMIKSLKYVEKEIEQPSTTLSLQDRLFCGVFPTGLVWADRSRYVHGDYAKLAYLNYESLKLKVEDDCPPDLRELIEKRAAEFQSKRGELFNTSETGNAVILGGGPWVYSKVKIGALHPGDTFYRQDPRLSLANGPDYATNLKDSLDNEVWVVWDSRIGYPYKRY